MLINSLLLKHSTPGTQTHFMGENTPHPPHTCTPYSPFSLTRISCLKALNSIHSQVILVLTSISSFWVPVGSFSVPPFSDLSFSLRLDCFFPSISLPPKAHLHATRFFPWWYFLSFHDCGHSHSPSCTFVSSFKFPSSPWSQTSSCSAGLLLALSPMLCIFTSSTSSEEGNSDPSSLPSQVTAWGASGSFRHLQSRGQKFTVHRMDQILR